MELFIGSHVSFYEKSGLLGSAEEAISYGANTFMFYTGSNQSSIRRPVDKELVAKGHEFMIKKGIDKNKVIVHAPYIINLANNSDARKYNFYIQFLRNEIDRCIELDIKNLVLHPGSAVLLEKKDAIENIAFGINKALEGKDITLIIEFMSGKGSEVGRSIDEIALIIDLIEKKEKIGVCLDTCHMNDAGVDLSSLDKFLDEFDEKIGIDKIKCFHINDSYNDLSSHKDRHANIGYGKIGFNTLINVIYNDRLMSVPKILETPYFDDNPPYKYEIESIKNKKFVPFIN